MGRGSVQAVSDILLLKGVDAGIVRKDTLAYLDRKDFAKDIRNQFVDVAHTFNEEMHVIAPRTIASTTATSTARPWWSICPTAPPS